MQGQAFVDRLMADGAVQDIPNAPGMRMISGLPLLSPNPESVASNVVIRHAVENFWSTCIELAEGIRVCALGTPGIGKTTTIPYLIYLLLSKKKTVVHLLRTTLKKNCYFEFVPQEPSSYSCQVYPETTDVDDIPSLRNPESLYILDPGQTLDNCNPVSVYLKARVILVSSPDSRHWGDSSFSKRNDDFGQAKGGIFLAYPIWTLNELLLARSILNKKLEGVEGATPLTENDVHDRFNKVGGVPRNVFSAKINFDEALKIQDHAIRGLLLKDAISIVSARSNDVLTFQRGQPKNSLLGMTSSSQSNFGDIRAFPVSSFVLTKVYTKHLTAIFKQLQSGQASEQAFEQYTIYFLSLGERDVTARICTGSSNKAVYERTFPVTIGLRATIEYVGDIVEHACKRQDTIFCPVDPNYAFIDFAYSTLDAASGKVWIHAFHATTGKTHHSKDTHIRDFIAAVGAFPAKIYYLVPSWRFKNFLTNPVEPTLYSSNISMFHVSIPSPLTDDEKAVAEEPSDA
jgi:Retrotransposon hot spot protein